MCSPTGTTCSPAICDSATTIAVVLGRHGASVNDRRAAFDVDMGEYRFLIEARVDRFMTWRRDLRARTEAGQDVAVELLVGAELVDAAAQRATATAACSRSGRRLWSGVHGLDGEVSEEIASGQAPPPWASSSSPMGWRT